MQKTVIPIARPLQQCGVCLIVLLLLALFISSAKAEQSASDTTVLSPAAESQALLAEIDRLSRQSSTLKSNFAKIPEVDYFLFLSLIVKIEEALRAKLDRLMEIQDELDATSPEKQVLQMRIHSIISEQSKALRKEVKALGKIIAKLRSSDLEQRGKDRFLQLSIERAEAELDGLMTAWQKNIERGMAAAMNIEKDRDQLNRILELRAITLATRIRLDLDTIALLKERFDHATDEEKKVSSSNSIFLSCARAPTPRIWKP